MKRGEEKKKRKKKKRKKKKEKRILGMDVWICMDFWTFVWILVCSISRV